MKKFTRSSLNNMLFVWLFVLGFANFFGCSTRTPPFSAEAYEKNIYFKAWENLESSVAKSQASTNRFNLLKQSSLVFKDQIQKPGRPQAILEPLKEMKTVEGFIADQNFETVNLESTGQIWPILVQIEVAANLISRDRGFRSWTSGGCFESYLEELGDQKKLTESLSELTPKSEGISDQNPILEKISNETDLLNFLQKSCALIGQKSAISLSLTERQTFYLAYKQNLNIRGRLLGLAQKQSTLIDEAYRMILSR